MRSTFLLMIAAAAFGSSLAIAQSALANAQESSAPEKKTPHALSKLSARLIAADSDSDGGLTRSEAEAAGLRRIVKYFERLDANADGKVTPEEIRGLLRAARPTT